MENVTSTEATAGSFEEDLEALNSEAEEGHRNSSLASTKRLLFKTVGKQDSNDLSRDYIGVKSYLHYFYESPSFKDPSIYEEVCLLLYLLFYNSSLLSWPISDGEHYNVGKIVYSKRDK